ncbi:MAG: N-acetyltransferase [Hyphomicrobiales bacterium]|nr:N-acetyltransferase [Hyphomicrobiales bacterium]
MFTIAPEPQDAALPIEGLLDRAFGISRHLKTAQRLRDGRLPAEGLAFIAHDSARILGTIRFWHVRAGDNTDALLLGPMAVEPWLNGQGIGSALIRHGLAQAATLGHGAVVLVGDEPYYQRFGFRADAAKGLSLPGPFEQKRLLGVELAPGVLTQASGLVLPTGPQDPSTQTVMQTAA